MSWTTRLRAARLFRQAQAVSAAGDQPRAARLLAQVGTLAPACGHLALHRAMVAARSGELVAALRTLEEAGGDEPVTRLFRGFYAARAGRLDDAVKLLDSVLEVQPHNRVAATAKAYALLRAGHPAEAVDLLEAGPSDNHEVLAWAWLELERLVQAVPVTVHEPPPLTLAVPASRRAAARLYRAGLAGAYGHSNTVLRRRWLAAGRRERPPLAATLLRPLLEALERRWPTDPLAAFRAVRAGGFEFERLAYQLGASLSQAGHAHAALPELQAACEAMADSPEVYEPQLFRAWCLADLHRYDEAADALAELARAEGESEPESAGSTHEFGQPYWHVIRARVRLSRGQSEGAAADLEKALAGEPAIFDERFGDIVGILRPTWSSDRTPATGSNGG